MLNKKIIINNLSDWIEKLDTSPIITNPMDLIEIKDLLIQCRRLIKDAPEVNDYDNQDEVKKQAKAAIEAHIAKMAALTKIQK